MSYRVQTSSTASLCIVRTHTLGMFIPPILQPGGVVVVAGVRWDRHGWVLAAGKDDRVVALIQSAMRWLKSHHCGYCCCLCCHWCRWWSLRRCWGGCYWRYWCRCFLICGGGRSLSFFPALLLLDWLLVLSPHQTGKGGDGWQYREC